MLESLQEALRLLRGCQEQHRGQLLPRHLEKLNAAAHWIDYVCDAIEDECSLSQQVAVRAKAVVVQMRSSSSSSPGSNVA